MADTRTIQAIIFDFGETLYHLAMSADDRIAYGRSLYMALGQFASVWPLDDAEAQKRTAAAIAALTPEQLGDGPPQGVDGWVNAVINPAMDAGDYREHDVRAIVGDRLVSLDVRLSARALDAYLAREVMLRYIQAYTDESVTDTLAVLRTQGYTLGVVSNFCTLPELAHTAFATLGLDAYFDPALVLFSCDVGWRKPAPQIYAAWRTAAGGIDPAACLFVGDRLLYDVWGAQQTGMRAVLTRQYFQDDPAQTAPNGTAIRPDAVIETLAALPSLLEKLNRGGEA